MAAYILLRAHSELLISIINSEIHCSAAEVHFKSSSVQEMQISQTSLKEYKNINASLDFQLSSEWVQVTFYPPSFHLSKCNLKNPPSRRLLHPMTRKLLKKSLRKAFLIGGTGAKIVEQYQQWDLLQCPFLLSLFSVSEAITHQQSTTELQLSCLWFLIKTKRRNPSKTLFAFQATQVIILIMDKIIMFETWLHYYSL